MFEKEAEEYFRENAYNFDEVTACRECMEFGYNKAKEEHKQDELGLIISNSSARAELENQLAQAKEILKRFIKWFDYISESENWKTIVADARKLLEDK